VGFIKDEKVNILMFLSGIPTFYKDKIKFDEPKTLEETKKKDKYMYEKSKGRATFQKLEGQKGKSGTKDERFQTPSIF
jgi:hypothetical protein